MTKPANDNAVPPVSARPAWYDQKVVEYMPFIMRQARNRAKGDDAEEIVSEACMRALMRWKSYSPEYNFGTWMVFVIRETVRNRRDARNSQKRSGLHVDYENVVLTTPARQEDAVDLARAISHIPAGRTGDIVVRRAMGEELSAIAGEYGLSRERVRQIEGVGRAAIRAAMDGPVKAAA